MAVGKNKATKATKAIDNCKGRVQRKVLVERGARFRCFNRCLHRKGAPDGKPTPNAETERTSTATLQQAGLTLQERAESGTGPILLRAESGGKRDRSDIVKLGGPADVRVPLSVLSRFPSPVPLSAVPLSAFQPDLVCKSHWTAGKVGVRAHGAWDHEMFARDLGWSVFQCVAVPLVAQKSEMAVSPDRVADGHKSFIPK